MFAVLVAAVLQAAAPLSSAPAAPPVATDRVAQLDALLSKRAYKELGQLVDAAASPQEFRTTLDWLRDRSLTGNSALVGIWYARDLIRVHDSLGGKTELLQTAGLALLLSEAMIRSDGAHCADRSAVEGRLTQLRELAPRPIAALQALPEAARLQLVQGVVDFEARTAAARPEDGDAPFVCTGGLSSMIAGLEAGAIKEVPTPPGMIGKTYAVGDGKTSPQTVAPEVWRERQAKLRSELPVSLRAALKLPPAS